MFEIVIPGDPVAQKRPRFSRRSGRAYDSQIEIKDCITWHIASQWGDREVLQGPVTIEFTFYMKIAGSTSKKRKALMEGTPCLKKKDWDNLGKIFSDAGCGVIYKDDAQLWDVHVKKIWSNDPRTVIKIVKQV